MRGATVAAEQDVAIAEKMIAADTVKVADAEVAGAVGVIGVTEVAGVIGAEEPAEVPGISGVAEVSGVDGTARVRGHLLWVREHLQHLSERAHIISGPATRVAELRQRPWWR